MKEHESKRFQQILEHQQQETLRSINHGGFYLSSQYSLRVVYWARQGA